MGAAELAEMAGAPGLAEVPAGAAGFAEVAGAPGLAEVPAEAQGHAEVAARKKPLQYIRDYSCFYCSAYDLEV